MNARSCPKCGAALAASAEACPSCGLAAAHFERFEAGQGGEDGASGEDGAAALPPALVPAWESCLARWDDESAHEAFLAAAAATGAFVAAGRLYRRQLRERGHSDQRAAAGLERVRRMAQAALLTRPAAGVAAPGTGENPEKRAYRTIAGLGVVLVLMALLGAITVHLVKNVRATEPAAAPGAVRPGASTPARPGPPRPPGR